MASVTFKEADQPVLLNLVVDVVVKVKGGLYHLITRPAFQKGFHMAIPSGFETFGRFVKKFLLKSTSSRDMPHLIYEPAMDDEIFAPALHEHSRFTVKQPGFASIHREMC